MKPSRQNSLSGRREWADPVQEWHRCHLGQRRGELGHPAVAAARERLRVRAQPEVAEAHQVLERLRAAKPAEQEFQPKTGPTARVFAFSLDPSSFTFSSTNPSRN